MRRFVSSRTVIAMPRLTDERQQLQDRMLDKSEPMQVRLEALKEFFADRISYVKDPKLGTPHWIWTQSTGSDDYPNVTFNKGTGQRVHSLIWEMVNGKVYRVQYPKGDPRGNTEPEIDHICTLKRCINPEHMQLISGSLNSKLVNMREAERMTWDKTELVTFWEMRAKIIKDLRDEFERRGKKSKAFERVLRELVLLDRSFKREVDLHASAKKTFAYNVSQMQGIIENDKKLVKEQQDARRASDPNGGGGHHASSSQKLEEIAKNHGWTFKNQTGSHRNFELSDGKRTHRDVLTIPAKKKDIPTGTEHSIKKEIQCGDNDPKLKL